MPKLGQLLKILQEYMIDGERAGWVGLSLVEAMKKQYEIELKSGRDVSPAIWLVMIAMLLLTNNSA